MATWDDVARIAGELPLTTEQSPRDWRVGKKLLAWERPLRKSDIEYLTENLTKTGIALPTGDILGVRVSDEGVKLALVAEEPDVYFTTAHFDGYAVVLVKLANIEVSDLKELITEAWLLQAPRRLAKDFLSESS